ncbi:MAG: Gfo/Idh/MocA family oxidoreductase, partial [Alphaproteobacteria bacterium]
DIVTDGDLGDILHVEANFCGPMGFRTGERGWRGEPAESPTGGMTGLGVHCLDAMIALCGPVAGVRALSLRQAVAGDVDDTTSVQLRLVGGQTGHLDTVSATGMLYRVQVFGTGGWAEMRGVGAAPQALEVVRLEYPPRTERFEPVSLERAELECFAEAVRDGVPFRVPTGDAVHGAAVLSAIGRAAGSDREVRLD